MVAAGMSLTQYIWKESFLSGADCKLPPAAQGSTNNRDALPGGAPVYAGSVRRKRLG